MAMQARVSAALSRALARPLRPARAVVANGLLAPIKNEIRKSFGCYITQSSPRRAVATAAISRQRERALWERGFSRVAGVDESGTGTLAGPVVAAACILPEGFDVTGVNDSKKLSPRRREELYERITTTPGVSYATSVVHRFQIDLINVRQASMRAMEWAVASLDGDPEHVLVDGDTVPGNLLLPNGEEAPAKAIVKGDGKEACIAAASIIATVTHNRLMAELDEEYPQYNFAENRCYGSREHEEALIRYGACDEHRRSCRLVRRLDPSVALEDIWAHMRLCLV